MSTMQEMDLEKTSMPDDQPSYTTYDPGFRDDSSFLSDSDLETQRANWREELTSLEDEIKSLSVTLNTKITRADELKRNLGLSHNRLKELQQTLQTGIKTIRDSTPYQKTTAAAKTVQEKTTSAFTTFGSSVSKKLGDVRNSQTFKSVEEKVESTYNTVKAKVRGSKSDIEDNEVSSPSAEDATTADNPNAVTTDSQ